MYKAAQALTTLAAAIFFLLIPQHAEPCTHKPITYKGQLGQSTQEGLLIHANGVEDLILQVNLDLHGQPKGPNELAWIVTIPAKPTSYKVANSSLFKDLFRWRERLYRTARTIFARSRVRKGRHKGLVFDRRVKIGAYDIQPIRGHSKADARTLNKWLKSRGFGTVNPKQLTYFLEKKFTFLCIKIALRGARKLKPLWITFPSQTPYYPLKFSSHQGTFELQLYTVTRRPVDYARSLKALEKIDFVPHPTQLKERIKVLLNPFGWQKNTKWSSAQMPPSVQKLLQDKANNSWHVNFIHSKTVNANHAIQRWKKDFFLALGQGKRERQLIEKRAEIKTMLGNRARTSFWSGLRSNEPTELRKWMKAWQEHKPLPSSGITLKGLKNRVLTLAPQGKGGSVLIVSVLGGTGLLFILALGFLAWRRQRKMNKPS